MEGTQLYTRQKMEDVQEEDYGGAQFLPNLETRLPNAETTIAVAYYGCSQWG